MPVSYAICRDSRCQPFSCCGSYILWQFDSGRAPACLFWLRRFRSISGYFSSSGLFSLIEISVIRSIFLLLLFFFFWPLLPHRDLNDQVYLSSYSSSSGLFSLIEISVIRSIFWPLLPHRVLSDQVYSVIRFISGYFSSSGLFFLIEFSVIRSIFLLLSSSR
jgi:hypothetical protein